MEPERLLPGLGRCFLLGVTDDHRRVDIQDQPVNLPPGDRSLGQVTADVGVLGPGKFTSLGTGGPQRGQGGLVEPGQQPPRGRIRRDRPEQGPLIPQHRQVRDRLTAIGERHGEIDSDPAWVMPALPLPQPGESITERAGQTGRVRQIGEQPGTCMTDHTPAAAGHRNLRTRCGSLHPASAFRDRTMWTLSKPYCLIGMHFFISARPLDKPLTKGPRLALVFWS